MGKSATAYAIVRSFRYPDQTALTISASLAQIGEFSFILAGLGVSYGILPPDGRDLIIAAAIISIFLNPLLFSFVTSRGTLSLRTVAAARGSSESRESEQSPPPGHVVLVGFGRVGRIIADILGASGYALTVIEDRRDAAKAAESSGLRVIFGNATEVSALKQADIASASKLLIAIPEGFEAAIIAKRARRLNPDLRIIARAHSEPEVEHLQAMGANEIVMAEREAAARMAALACETGEEEGEGLVRMADS